jgi:hypothetical protein
VAGEAGGSAFFTTAAELIDRLSAAFREGRLAEALTTYTHPAVLVIDEVGYLTYGTDAANMLFHVVNDRHRRKRSMIFTTNKPTTAWGHVLHDEDLAQPSSIASSSGVASSHSTDLRCEPDTSGLTKSPPRRQITTLTTWPECPELSGQSFRNLHP